jgi:hypothetical protein
MVFPTIRVEAAFVVDSTSSFVLDDVVKGVLDTAALSDEAWTDITDYANDFSVRRGASRAEGPVVRFEAGTMTVRLDNSDRRFDPTNSDSPYWSLAADRSQVEPMRPVRIIADFQGASYPIFTGYADEWAISYEGPSMSYCVLTATDATKVLSDYDRVALGTAVGDGELSGARVARILDSVEWPIGQRDIDDGQSTLQGTTMDRSGWEELLLVQDSEIGQVFVDARGYVVFRDRYANMNDAGSVTVQAAFGDGAGELPFVDHDIVNDHGSLANVVRIAVVGGSQQTAEDSISRQLYLTHTHERTDLILEGDDDAADYAAFVLSLSRDPELRFDNLKIQGSDDDVLWDHILGRQFGDLITLTRRPPGGGPVVTRECYIIGVQHEVPGPNEWRTTWALQTATRWSFMTLDDATLGVLDSNALAF